MLAGGLGIPEAVRAAADTLIRYGQHLRPQLRSLAQAGSETAAEILVDLAGGPDPEQLDRARDALSRLTAPQAPSPAQVFLGTSALRDAALVRLLSEGDRSAAVEALIAAGRGSEISMNRGERIDAATNLAHSLPKGGTVARFYTAAITAATTTMVPSLADVSLASMKHPLGAFRLNLPTTDLTSHWMLLAAVLAHRPEELTQVRDYILLKLPRADDEDAYYLTKALQALPEDAVAPHVLLLAAHPHWAVRSLSAIVWVNQNATPSPLGLLLARDGDIRVRKALASAVAGRTGPEYSQSVEHLSQDPRYSVRVLLDRRTCE
jgi:hypothetical protein